MSWIRLSDVSLLAVGGYTYTSDLRLEAEREDAGGEEEVGSSSWALVIRNVSTGDAGQYECQVSTSPHMAATITLTVRGE